MPVFGILTPPIQWRVPIDWTGTSVARLGCEILSPLAVGVERWRRGPDLDLRRGNQAFVVSELVPIRTTLDQHPAMVGEPTVAFTNQLLQALRFASGQAWIGRATAYSTVPLDETDLNRPGFLGGSKR